MTTIKKILFAAMLTAILFTCEKIPDYCGTGEIYDPGCEFCFGSRAFPLCGNGRYNPLTSGCDQNGRVGTRCSDGSVVPSGTPCGGYTLTAAAAPADVGDVTYNLPAGPTYAVGDLVVLSAAPKEKYKDEYEFTGWAGAQPSGGATGATYVMGNNDNGNNAGRSQVTIVAMFKPAGKGKLITEAFPKEHGGVTRNPDKETYGNGESVTVKAEPNTGYTFIGWSGANTSENEEITISMDESKTLVAMFAPVAHTLRADVYPPDGGAVFVNSAALAGNAARNVEANIAVWAKEGEGYVFDKWTGTAVRFEDAGKQGTRATLSEAGATITANFRRGSGGGTAVAPPLICTLTVKKNIDDGGTVSLNPDGNFYKLLTEVTATVKANDKYTFIGWTGAGMGKDSVVKITMDRNMELYANFQRDGDEPPVTPPPTPPIDTTVENKTYNITFNAGIGGTVSPTIRATDATGRLASLPTPTKRGYSFNGWFTTMDTSGTRVTVGATGTVFTSDTVIYANWYAETYTITYNLDNGTMAVANPSSYTVETPTFTLNKPTRTGYIFAGWSWTEDYSTKMDTTVTIAKGSTGNKNYTANWEAGGGDFVGDYDYSLSCGARGACGKALMPDGKVWMTENLNYNVDSSWCYDKDPANCAKYGRLYTWDAAKTACPTGWRLPTRQEWQTLVDSAGGNSNAGSKLKSSSGWNNNGGFSSTDEYGFSALPGGYRRYSGTNFSGGDYGFWWTATELDALDAYYRDMCYGYDDVVENFKDKGNGFSVRCVEGD